MKYTLVHLALIGVIITGLASPVMAHSDDDGISVKTRSNDDVIDVAEEEIELETEDSVKIKVGEKAEARLQQQQARIEDRQERIKAHLEDQKNAKKERLAGVRLAKCENREVRINQLMAKSVDTAKRHLGVIQRIEEGVKKFYEDKNLSSDEYAATVAAVDEKEADAVATIEVMAGSTFECDDTDAASPASMIKNIVHSRHDALKSYRTAVKDLLLVVKKSLNDGVTE